MKKLSGLVVEFMVIGCSVNVLSQETVETSKTTGTGSISKSGDTVEYTYKSTSQVLGAGLNVLATSSWNYTYSGNKAEISLFYGTVGKSIEKLIFTTSNSGTYTSTTTLYGSGSVTTVTGTFVLTGLDSANDNSSLTNYHGKKIENLDAEISNYTYYKSKQDEAGFITTGTLGGDRGSTLADSKDYYQTTAKETGKFTFYLDVPDNQDLDVEISDDLDIQSYIAKQATEKLGADESGSFDAIKGRIYGIKITKNFETSGEISTDIETNPGTYSLEVSAPSESQDANFKISGDTTDGNSGGNTSTSTLKDWIIDGVTQYYTDGEIMQYGCLDSDCSNIYGKFGAPAGHANTYVNLKSDGTGDYKGYSTDGTELFCSGTIKWGLAYKNDKLYSYVSSSYNIDPNILIIRPDSPSTNWQCDFTKDDHMYVDFIKSTTSISFYYYLKNI